MNFLNLKKQINLNLMIMKKWMYILLGSGLSLLANGQHKVTDACNMNAEKFKEAFNKNEPQLFYSLLSKPFQKDFSFTDYSNFIKDIKDQYGVINRCSWSRYEDGAEIFKNEHQNGSLQLNLYCNPNGEIDGLQIIPWKDKEVKNIRSNYLSDNHKADSLDIVVDKAVEDFMKTPANCGLSIAVLKDGKTRFFNYGEIRRQSNQLPNAKSIYEIGSVSKVFTGLLLAKAIDDKKVKPDDDIRRYLPETCKNLTANGQAITLQHLVTHTSGLPRIPEDLVNDKTDTLNPYAHYTKEKIITYLSTLKPDSKPGLKMDYSNLGMALVGLILSDVYKASYEELVLKFIARPFGMTSTRMNLTGEEFSRFAEGYNSDGAVTPHWDLANFAAAGGLRSCAEDMIQFMEANLKAESAFTRSAQQILFESGRDKMGMGWVIQNTKSGYTLIWHNGGTYGFSSFAGMIKEKNCAVVVLANSGNRTDDIALAILKYLQK